VQNPGLVGVSSVHPLSTASSGLIAALRKRGRRDVIWAREPRGLVSVSVLVGRVLMEGERSEGSVGGRGRGMKLLVVFLDDPGNDLSVCAVKPDDFRTIPVIPSQYCPTGTLRGYSPLGIATSLVLLFTPSS